MATPTATAPAPFGSLATVQTPDVQNAPPSFLELASGKILFFFSPGSSHTSVDSNFAVKTAVNEAAARAGNFSATTILDAFDGTWGAGNGQACQIMEGPHKGRVILISAKGRQSPNIWKVYVRYSDDDGVTWSTPVEIPSVFDGGFGIDATIQGMSALIPPVERPGTNGQELLLPVLGFDSDENYEYSKLIASMDGGMTWGLRSVIHQGGGPSATFAPSEPTLGIVYLANGTPRLMVGVNLWPTQVYVKFSDDWGYTWSHVGTGITVATNAIAPPAFVQCPDGSVLLMYRNLADSEHTWLARSIDYGQTWPQKWLFDSNGRMRYGNFQALQSLRVGMCYGTETLVFPSTQAGIYFQTFTVTPPTGGAPPTIVGSNFVAGDPGEATFLAQLTTGGMDEWHRVEYGPTTAYGSATNWERRAYRPALPWTISETLPMSGETIHARLVAKNLSGTTNGADATLAQGPTLTPATETDAAQPLTYGLRISGLTLDPNPYWQQAGTALTVHAAAGRRREVTGVVTSSTGGPFALHGPDAADFEVSLNGTDWASSVIVPAGDTPIWLSAQPSGTGALSAELGVPA